MNTMSGTISAATSAIRFHHPTMRSRRPISLALLVFGSILATIAFGSPRRSETYSESLLLTPFPDGKLHSDFRFDLTGPWTEEAPTLGSNAISKMS